jgi:hypothetical protein
VRGAVESLRDLIEVYDRNLDVLKRGIKRQLRDDPRLRAI